MYNFTIYESFRQNGYCYFWEEQHGKRGSNEIASNLYEYLRMVDQLESIKEIKFFCDNCTGQNKNVDVFTMIKYFLHLSKNINIITITYLIVGHTYMPVDSMHSVIEKSIKKTVTFERHQSGILSWRMQEFGQRNMKYLNASSRIFWIGKVWLGTKGLLWIERKCQ